MIGLDADVCAVQLPLKQTPEIFHCVGVDVATDVLNGMIHNRVLEISGKPIVGLKGCRARYRLGCSPVRACGVLACGARETADAILAVGNQPNTRKPFVQTQGRVLEDRADVHGELLPASAAFPNAPSREKHRALSLTVGTLDAIRPATRKVLQRVIGIRWVCQVSVCLVFALL